MTIHTYILLIGVPDEQGNIIFPVQLTTSRIGNLTRLIHTLLYVMTIHTYILLIEVPDYSSSFFLFIFQKMKRILVHVQKMYKTCTEDVQYI